MTADTRTIAASVLAGAVMTALVVAQGAGTPAPQGQPAEPARLQHRLLEAAPGIPDSVALHRKEGARAEADVPAAIRNTHGRSRRRT